MKQTAVDWLVEQYTQGNYSWEVYEQAKEMDKEQQREKLIGLLDWMNQVAQDNPMVFETDSEDIVDMYLEEIKREDYQQERSYSEEEVEAIAKDAYKNYEKITNDFQLENPIDDFIIKTIRGEMIKIETEDGDDYRILTQKEFIKKIKTNNEFAKKWGET
jgi:hypothetical protein